MNTDHLNSGRYQYKTPRQPPALVTWKRTDTPMNYMRKSRLGSVLGASLVAAVAAMGLLAVPATAGPAQTLHPLIVPAVVPEGCEALPEGGFSDAPIGSDSSPSVVVGRNFTTVPGAAEAEGVILVGGDASFDPGPTMSGGGGKAAGGIYNLGVVGKGSGIGAPAGSDALITGVSVSVRSGRLAINEIHDPKYEGGDILAGGAINNKADISRNLAPEGEPQPEWKENRSDALDEYQPWLKAIDSYSDFYKGLDAVGTVAKEQNRLTLTGDNTANRQVFNLDAGQLSQDRAPIELHFKDIHKDAVIIINVTGKNAQVIPNYVGLNGVQAFTVGGAPGNVQAFVQLATHLMWNFVDAQSVYLGKSDQFLGSVLVKNPESTTTLGTSTNGRILVAGNLQHGEGLKGQAGEASKGLEIHNFPFVHGFGCGIVPGEPGPAKTFAVGDVVWIDANNNGIQEAGEEEFLEGVTVELLDGEGATAASTTTDANGRYLFDKLPAGTYQVKFTLTEAQAASYNFTGYKAAVDGSSTAADSDAQPGENSAVGVSGIFTLGEDSQLVQAAGYDGLPFEATGGIDPTWDAGVVFKDGTLSIAKTADPASGTTVNPGQTVSYTVTASAQDGRAANVLISDDLSDVLDDATFVPGSAKLVIDGGTPVQVADPAEDQASPGNYTLTAGPFDLPAGRTAVLSYSVTVNTDAWFRTLNNSVTGTTGGTPTDGCGPCTTTHPTPGKLFIEKLGEDVNSELVRMDGSAWNVYADDGGTPGALLTDPAVVAVDGDTGLFVLAFIEPGTYWLEESAAPEGFNLLAELVKFTVAADGRATLESGTGGGVVTVSQAGALPLISVRDVPALQLPATGGGGTAMFLTGGVLLLIGSAILALRQRRATQPSGAAQTTSF